MPSAMTHSTKKIDSEEPFSASTAFGTLALVAGAAVVVVVVEVVTASAAFVMLLTSRKLFAVVFVYEDGFTVLFKL